MMSKIQTGNILPTCCNTRCTQTHLHFASGGQIYAGSRASPGPGRCAPLIGNIAINKNEIGLIGTKPKSHQDIAYWDIA